MTKKIIYKLQRQENLFWLRVAIKENKKTPLLIRLLLDTGSNYTVLPKRLLEAIGCNCKNPLTYKRIVTASGIVTVPIVEISYFNCLE